MLLFSLRKGVIFVRFSTNDQGNLFRPEVSVEQTPAEILYQVLPVHFKSLLAFYRKCLQKLFYDICVKKRKRTCGAEYKFSTKFDG